MTLRSRLRRRLLVGAAGAVASLAALTAASPAHAAYTPALQQYAGAAGCVWALADPTCAQVDAPSAGQGFVRDGDDLYVSVGDDDGGAPGLYHYRRTAAGLEFGSCVVAEASQEATALGCGIVPLLPRYATPPAVADDAVYVGGSRGDVTSSWSGVVTAVPRDPLTGALSAAGATCRATSASDAPGCTSEGLDRLGAGVRAVVVAPDGSTLHALAWTGPATQVVTYERGTGGDLDPVSCLANVDAACDRPPVSERLLLASTAEMVVAPDGLDVYLAGNNGLVHLARNEATGALSIDDCVGDREEVAGLCDKGPGDFLGVSRLSMTSDEQVIAIAYGDESRSVVRLLRDGSGTLTEAGCIGTEEGDGCGLGTAVTNPSAIAATPDDKNVIVANSPGQPFVTLVAGGAAGLRPLDAGTAGCAGQSGTVVPAGCSADVRGVTLHEGSPWIQTQIIARDDEVIVTTHRSMLFFARGRAPGCLQRNTTAQRPAGALSLVCADPNGDPVSLIIGRPPAHGTLGEISQNSSSVVFTPDDTYEGSDSFTYGAGDGTFTSAAVTYNLTLPTGPNTVKPDPGGTGGPDNGSTNGDGTSNGGGDKGTAADPTADLGKGADTKDPVSITVSPPKSTPAAGAIDLTTVGKQLTVSSKRIVAFKLTCRGTEGAPACKGALRLAAASRLVVDGKRQVVTFGRKDYAIPPGATFTVSLRLPAKLAALVTKKKPVAATVLAIGTAPSSITPVQAKVTLKR